MRIMYSSNMWMIHLTLCIFGLVVPVHMAAFDSIATLKALANHQNLLFDAIIESLITENEEDADLIRRHLQKLKSWTDTNSSLSEEEWDEYMLDLVGHPINALGMIKDWVELQDVMTKINTQRKTLAEIKEIAELSGISFPGEADYLGTLEAILRLQRTYNIPSTDLMAGKIYNFTAKQGMDKRDMLEMGNLSLKEDHHLAIYWLAGYLASLKVFDDEAKAAYKNVLRIYKKAGDIKRVQEASELLDKANNSKQLETVMTDFQEEMEQHHHRSGQSKYWKSNGVENLGYYESLCRRENIKNSISVNKDLICVYRRNLLPYVLYKEEIHSFSPRISQIFDVISDKKAKLIKEKAFPGLERAKVGYAKNRKPHAGRVGKVTWLYDSDPDMVKYSQRVSDITGLSTTYREQYADADAFQVVNYGIGGQYVPHYDFYVDPKMMKNLPAFVRDSGDRIATYMIYLSDVTAGGATVFPEIGVRVPAVKNAAAFWFNYNLAGEMDFRSLHAGCPVLLGEKWITTKWVRQMGQIFTRRCGLNKDESDPIYNYE